MPYNPVQKKRTDCTGGKRDYAEILDTTGTEADVSAFGAKKGIGKAGVHLRYHSPPEYAKLSKEEKDELREWRQTSGAGKCKGKPNRGKDFKKEQGVRFETNKAIASAVEKKVAEKLKALDQTQNKEDNIEAYIMSIIIKKHSGKKVDISSATADEAEKSTTTTAPPSLKGIIRKEKNGTPT
jgi:hypothetical protein